MDDPAKISSSSESPQGGKKNRKRAAPEIKKTIASERDLEVERRKSTRVRRQKLRHDHFFDSSSRSDLEIFEEVAVTE